MRTRKKCYNLEEENTQLSSNTQHIKRRRLAEKNQSEIQVHLRKKAQDVDFSNLKVKVRKALTNLVASGDLQILNTPKVFHVLTSDKDISKGFLKLKTEAKLQQIRELLENVLL